MTSRSLPDTSAPLSPDPLGAALARVYARILSPVWGIENETPPTGEFGDLTVDGADGKSDGPFQPYYTADGDDAASGA